MTEHRILTVRQPWAKAIVDGHKPVENRSGGFTTKYRGPLWIHAGAAWSARGMTSPLVLGVYPLIFFTDGAGHPVEGRTALDRNGFAFGAVLGRVDVSDAHRSEPGCCDTSWAETSYEDAAGQTRHDLVHLVLANPQALARPIAPAAGRLGLWRPDHDLAFELELAADLLHQESAPC